MITKETLFDHEGFMILDKTGEAGLFAWHDKGSRPRKRKVKGKTGDQTWDKIWFATIYKSTRYPGSPWRFAYAGGKFPFCRLHMEAHQFVLLFELIPFLYKEFFGASAPWSSMPVEAKKEFKPKTEDDEVAKLERELARLRV